MMQDLTMQEMPSDLTIMIPAWVDGVLQPAEKLAVHQQGLRHKAISVFITSGGYLLLQQRAMGKYHTPGLWANACCTHPHWGEDTATCAIRRLREELGLTGLVPQYRKTLEYRADVGGGLIEHEVVDLFIAETAPGLPLAPDPAEVMATRWISYEDLTHEVAETPEAFTPWLKIYLRDHGDDLRL